MTSTTLLSLELSYPDYSTDTADGMELETRFPVLDSGASSILSRNIVMAADAPSGCNASYPGAVI